MKKSLKTYIIDFSVIVLFLSLIFVPLFVLKQYEMKEKQENAVLTKHQQSIIIAFNQDKKERENPENKNIILKDSSFYKNIVSNKQLLTNKKIKVMIVDTAIDTNHPFLKPFFPHQLVYKKQIHSHGTKVSGVIAQRLNEVFGTKARSLVEFVSCEAMFGEKTNLVATIDCLKEAIVKKVDIINYSASGNEPSDLEKQYIQLLQKNNIKIVVSSGNEGGSTDKVYPCNYKLDNIICVSSIKDSGEKSAFANYGNAVSFFANGVKVPTVAPDNEKGFFNGTSAAAPQVTALLIVKMLTNSKKAHKILVKNGHITEPSKLKIAHRE